MQRGADTHNGGHVADLSAIQEAVKQEDEAVDVVIYDRAEQPYTSTVDGSESTIGVVGTESARYQKALAKRLRASVRAGKRNRSDREIMEARVELAASAVVRWSGWEMHGTPWPCTPENVRELLGTPHILAQVEEAIEGHQRFFRSASTN